MGGVARRLGDFEIVREIGRGGMGVVYEATQVSLHRSVALKVLSCAFGSSPRAVARFHREAESAARLHHPHIVPVYAQGEHEGVLYYAMELVEGKSLDRVIEEAAASATTSERALSPTLPLSGPGDPDTTSSESPEAGSTTDLGRQYYEDAARLAAQVADALDYAHKQGVIHRDVKPHNIIVKPDGTAVVTDFGLARFAEQPAMTMPGEVMGTPVYMSPEQVRGSSVESPTDIYSLGVTLYEMLTLRRPFGGETRDAIMRDVVGADPVRPRRLSRHLPRDLETICLKAMEKDPARRYQGAGEMAHDLRAFVDGYPISARPVSFTGRLLRRARRQKALTAALAFTVLTVAAGAGVGINALAIRREMRDREVRDQAETERNAVRAAAELEQHRSSLIAEGLSLLRLRSHPLALAKLREAAGIRQDYLTHTCLWALASRYCDAPQSAMQVAEEIKALAVSPAGGKLAYPAACIYLCDSKSGKVLHEFRGPDTSYSCVGFSPDGSVLAGLGAGGDHSVRLWDVATGAALASLPGHQNIGTCVSFSPDGQRLASGALDGSIRLWDVAARVELLALPAGGAPTSVAFSADGSMIAAGVMGRHAGMLWDAATGRELRQMPEHNGDVGPVAFSPDGQLVASGGEDGAVNLAKPADGTAVRSLAAYSDWVLALAFTPDSRILATSGRDAVVRLWDPQSGRQLEFEKALRGSATVLQFADDGRTLVCGCDDGVVRLWDVATGQQLQAIQTPPFYHWQGVVFSPGGGRLAVPSGSDTIQLWDTGVPELLRVFRTEAGPAWAAAFSPDGSRLAGGGWAGIHVWDVMTGADLRELPTNAGWPEVFAYDATGTRLASGQPGREIVVCDTSTGAELSRGPALEGGMLRLAFRPDGTAIAASVTETEVSLSDAVRGEQLSALSPVSGTVTCVGFGHGGDVIAIGSSEGLVSVWDTETGDRLQSFVEHVGPVVSVDFDASGRTLVSSAEAGVTKVRDLHGGVVRTYETKGTTGALVRSDAGLIATTYRDGSIRLWPVPQPREFPDHAGDVQCLRFSPDSRLLASSGEDSIVRVWDVATGRVLRKLTGHYSHVGGLAFSPDGELLVSTGVDGSVRAWDPEGGQQLRELRGHEGWVFGVDFSPDGSLLATGSVDATVRLWDPQSGADVGSPLRARGQVWAVVYSPLGLIAASSGAAGAVQVWDSAAGGELRTVEFGQDAGRLALAPDGKTLAVACGDGVVRLVDCPGGGWVQALALQATASSNSMAADE